MMRNIIKTDLNNVSLIFLIFLPAALVAGPFLAEIIINFIAIKFLIENLKSRNNAYLKDYLFVFFLLFYFIQIVSLINSEIFSESALNVFSYIRYPLFVFGVADLLEKKKTGLKYLYFSITLTIFIVALDGFKQFFSDTNFIGYPKYRIDRISGFFNDDLILGSYLFRFFPVLLVLTLFFENKTGKNIFYFNIILLLSIYLLTFLTGERSSFILLSIFVIIIIVLLQISIRFKIYFLTLIVIILSSTILINPTMKDRYIDQIIIQVFDKNKSLNLSEYQPMYDTSIKMFKENPILGVGTKGYRYHCRDSDYITYFHDRKFVKDNTKIYIDFGWKEIRNLNIIEVYVNDGDEISVGDKLFSFHFTGDKKNIQIFNSSLDGKILKIHERDLSADGIRRYINNDVFADIKPSKVPDQETGYYDSCNTHPHNYYFQLLAETGLLGFSLIFAMFLYLSYLIIKTGINSYFFKRRDLNNLEICLIVYFFVILWPLIPTGNFFNNWLNIISIFPLGIYLHVKKINNN